MFGLEAAKVIAAICMVIAGDNPSMSSVVSQITGTQSACHAYYADCLKVSNLQACMAKRPAEMNRLYQESIRRPK